MFNTASADAFIADQFTSREVASFRACVVPAMQADYFRYCVILALGGLYSDVDFKCTASIRPLVPVDGKGQLFRGPKGNVINSIFAFGSPGHPFLELALEIATANIECRLCDHVYYTTGPPIFMSLVNLHRLGSFDALIKQIPHGSPQREWARSYCEVVDDYSRVSRALQGIEVSQPLAYQPVIQPPTEPLRYRQSPLHWMNFKGSIFAQPPSQGPTATKDPQSPV